LPLSPRTLTTLRILAAAVRDREPPYAAINPDLAGLAGTLCRLLDIRGGLLADNARASTDDSIRAVVSVLARGGVVVPELEERS